jgi:hypothetical protein
MFRPLRQPILALALPTFLASACLSQGTRITPIASAKQISSEKDLIGGPNATAAFGDFLLKNERIRVVIQRAVAPARAPFTRGGNLIDADRVRFPGEQGGDRFGGMTLLINGVRTVSAKNVFVLEDGSATGYAVVRAEGDDATYPGLSLKRFAEAVSRPVDPGFDPAKRLDVLVKTDYVLKPGANYLEVRTTFINRRSVPTKLVVGDVIDNGSTVPFVSEGLGFALPGEADDYAAAARLVAFEGDGVSYGYRVGRQLTVDVVAKDQAHTSRADTVIAAFIPFGGMLGAFQNFGDLTNTVNPEAGDNGDRYLEVPAAGSVAFTRFIIVGQGDGGEIIEGVNEIEQELAGIAPEARTAERVAGAVTIEGSGEPAVGADVAVFAGGLPYIHVKTDANGQYRTVLPPGKFQLAVNLQGHPYAEDTSAPTFTDVSVGDEDGKTNTVDLSVKPAARLRLFVKDTTPLYDADGNYAPAETPLAARVVLTRDGGDPSPARLALAKLDVWPFRPEEPAVVMVDPSGQRSLDVEPGDYAIVGFHGPAFSMYRTRGTFAAGTRSDRVIELARSVSAGGALAADFAATTYLSRGSLSPAGRIEAAYADGVELVALTDVGARTEALETVKALDAQFKSGKESRYDVAKHIGAVSGERVLTSGYGSFAAWPVYFGAALPLGGQIAWAGGDDPALTPAEILAALLGLHNDKDYVAGTGLDAVAPTLAALDAPFTAPGKSELGYFDAADVRVDWAKAQDAGAFFAGELAVAPADVGLAGKTAADLWAGNWQAFNIAPVNDEAVVWLGMNAYFAFLNAGVNPDKRGIPQVVAIGNPVGGDVFAPVGGFRNLVFTGVAAPKNFTTDPVKSMTQLDSDLVAKRANVVSNGPYVNVRVAPTWVTAAAAADLAGFGGLVDLGQKSVMHFHVAVTTPCWAPVERIDLFMNTRVTEPAVVNNALAAMPTPVSTFTTFTSRRIVSDVGTRAHVDVNACRADGTGAGRIEIVKRGILPVVRDAWLVVVVTGGAATPAGARPIAITNPIYVDQDGGGTFTAPCPGAACPNTGVSRLGWYTPERAASFR